MSRVLAFKKIEDFPAINVPVDSVGVYMETDAMTLGGILPNDILIIRKEDPERIQPNRVVAFHYAEGVSAGRYFPPYFMPHSTNSAHVPVRADTVNVIGEVVQIVRKMI